MSDSDSDDVQSEAAHLMATLNSASKGAGIESKVKGMTLTAKSGGAGAKRGGTVDIDTTLDSGPHELGLKQQAAILIQQRASEIENYHATLGEALTEVKRLRSAEEARLAQRVAAVQEAYAARLSELQAEHVTRVEDLERRTLAHLAGLRQESEAAVAARVRALAGHISPIPSPRSPGAVAGGGRSGGSAAATPLPAFLMRSGAGAARGGYLTSQYSPNTTGHVGGGGGGSAQRTLFSSSLVGGSAGVAGLHRTEPKVLELLGGDEESDS